MDTNQKTWAFVLNWPPLYKCLLMLSVAVLIHTAWLIWKLYIYFHPSLWVYVSADYLRSSILLNSMILLVLAVPMLLCWYLRASEKAQMILPYACILIYGLSMVHEAYLVGIMSPATSLTFVMSVIIGLLLFKRILIYSTLAIVFTIFIWLMHATIEGKIPYAPIFINTLGTSTGKATVFWTFAMLWFGLPILIGGFILLEMLLSQWRQREKNIEVLSQVDPLTGLYNRRTLYRFLSGLLNKKYPKPFLHSLILLDLDLFKQINDSYGHVMGDRILVEAAQVLKSVVRQQDIVGRFGGEEFIIILTNTSYQQTRQVAERCRNELMSINIYDDHNHKIAVTASFGTTHFDSTSHDIDTVLKKADQALYEAKDLGRNQVVHYWDYAAQQI